MEELKEFIKRHKSNEEKSKDFGMYLDTLMAKHGFKKDSELYNKANISKQSWSLIISGKVTPSLNTLVKIAFALEVDNHECKYLFKKAGYTLASSSDYALIIRYCIENKIYDLYKLNEYLKENGFEDYQIS